MFDLAVKAIAKNEIKRLKKIVTRAQDVCREHREGYGLLHIAILYDNVEAVGFLLGLAKQGICVAEKNQRWLPLHLASIGRDNYGKNPFCTNVGAEHRLQICQMLLQAFPQQIIQLCQQYTPVHFAAAGDHLDLFKFYEEFLSVNPQYKLSLRNKKGPSLLLMAASCNACHVVKYLLKEQSSYLFNRTQREEITFDEDGIRAAIHIFFKKYKMITKEQRTFVNSALLQGTILPEDFGYISVADCLLFMACFVDLAREFRGQGVYTKAIQAYQYALFCLYRLPDNVYNSGTRIILHNTILHLHALRIKNNGCSVKLLNSVVSQCAQLISLLQSVKEKIPIKVSFFSFGNEAVHFIETYSIGAILDKYSKGQSVEKAVKQSRFELKSVYCDLGTLLEICSLEYFKLGGETYNEQSLAALKLASGCKMESDNVIPMPDNDDQYTEEKAEEEGEVSDLHRWKL
jgi:hypothetical protein